MSSDRILGIAAVIAGIAYIAGAFQIRTSFISDPLGAKTFPILIGSVATLCGVIIALRPGPQPQWPGPRTFASLALSVAMLVLYAYTLVPLGFVLPTAVVAGVLSYQIAPHAVPAALTGIGLSVGLFVLFRYALGLSLVPFPRALAG